MTADRNRDLMSRPAERASRHREALSGRPATGRRGEDAAARFLARSGRVILHRNWRCRLGELDIVAEERGTLVFVEVRTRRASSRFGTAAESVDGRKLRRIAACAQLYLQAFGKTNVPIRFDVIACTVESDDGLILEHIQAVM